MLIGLSIVFRDLDNKITGEMSKLVEDFLKEDDETTNAQLLKLLVD